LLDFEGLNNFKIALPQNGQARTEEDSINDI
jgi:hypothetical protein